MNASKLLPFENTFAKNIIPDGEKQRLKTLRSYNLLDTPPEEAFQNIVHLVAEHFDVPIALISLVDEKEVFFKAAIGMDGVKKASRGMSLCSLAVLSDSPTIIDKPADDPCLIANPLVHGAFGLRFYAAAPLIAPDGQRVGAVCIVDRKVRVFSKKQEAQLVRFSKIVMHEMELRLSVQRRQKELERETRLRQRMITNAVIQAQERERSRLGLELHDNVSQMLTTVKLYTEIALDGHVDTGQVLRKSSRYLQDCINEIRFISHQLSTPTLGDISLQDSLKELAKSINTVGKVQVQVKADRWDLAQVNEDFHLCIYRIVQEQLNNILKYANAAEAIIMIENNDENINVSVTDNGKGFDTTVKSNGIGFLNIKARAENFGGTMKLQSSPGGGCRLSVQFPPFKR